MGTPPLVTAELAIQELCDPAALAAIADEWRALWDRCPQLHCFQRPEWLLPWVRHFFKGENIWSLAVRREGRLVALAPLFIHRHQQNFDVRQVSFLGAGITDYLGILCEPDIAAEAVETVFRHLMQNSGRWDICDLQELPGQLGGGPWPIPAGLQHVWMNCSTCPVMPLPADEAEFDEMLHGRFKSLRRIIHKLERDPAVEITAADSGTFDEYLEDLFSLHRERWKERRETGMFANPAIRGFHSQVAEGFMAAGFLRCYRMRCDGETVSVWYGFSCRQRFYAYLTGFDPAFSRFSPGQVLLAYSMKRAIAEAARYYDFLRKTEDFKHRWGGVDNTNRRLLAWHQESRLPSPDFVEAARVEFAAV